MLVALPKMRSEGEYEGMVLGCWLPKEAPAPGTVLVAVDVCQLRIYGDPARPIGESIPPGVALDGDGDHELVIPSPMADDGKGVVYLLLGSQE